MENTAHLQNCDWLVTLYDDVEINEEDVFYTLGEGLKNIFLVNFNIVIQKMRCVFQKYVPGRKLLV